MASKRLIVAVFYLWLFEHLVVLPTNSNVNRYFLCLEIENSFFLLSRLQNPEKVRSTTTPTPHPAPLFPYWRNHMRTLLNFSHRDLCTIESISNHAIFHCRRMPCFVNRYPLLTFILGISENATSDSIRKN